MRNKFLGFLVVVLSGYALYICTDPNFTWFGLYNPVVQKNLSKPSTEVIRTQTTTLKIHEDVGELTYSLQDYYKNYPADSEAPAAGLDGDLRAIFDDLAEAEGEGTAHATRPAAELIRKLERQLMADVFRWTGHFPEKTRTLMRHLAKRAEALQQVYPVKAEREAVVGVTILVTSLAMNHVHRGGYFPETQLPSDGDDPARAAASPPDEQPLRSQGPKDPP